MLEYEGHLNVATGGIQIVSSSFIKENGGTLDKGGVDVISIPNGRYTMKISIPHVSKWDMHEIIDVKDGELVVGDLCCCFKHKPWIDLLDKTTFFVELDNGININTSGDGSFDVTIIFKKSSDVLEIPEGDFLKYEDVRISGVTNMFDIEMVHSLSSLSKNMIRKIMKNYKELKERFVVVV